MSQPFPWEALRQVVRWVVLWALEPGPAVGGEVEIQIHPEAKKTETKPDQE